MSCETLKTLAQPNRLQSRERNAKSSRSILTQEGRVSAFARPSADTLCLPHKPKSGIQRKNTSLEARASETEASPPSRCHDLEKFLRSRSLGPSAVRKEEETLSNRYRCRCRCRNRLRGDLIDWKPDSIYQKSWIDSVPIWLPNPHPITATAAISTADPREIFLRTPLSP